MKYKINPWLAVVILAAVVVVSGTYLTLGVKPEAAFSPKPQQATAPEAVEAQLATNTYVGTGWSAKTNPEEATKEAINMALENNMYRAPDFLIMFATSGSDTKAIISNARKLLGNKTKIYGGTSDSRAVMTEKGFVKATEKGYSQALLAGERSIAVMALSSKDITFGVGSANFKAYDSVKEAAKSAVLNAMKNAGKSPNELPKIVLVTPTLGVEDEVIEGIEEVIGKNTPMLGGTAGGPNMSVFGENDAYYKGVSLAVIYTNLPVGWTFEGGFDVTDTESGVVTKTDGQAIVEINDRPALDVYDDWLGGEIDRLYSTVKRPDLIRDLLVLHPIYRRYHSSAGQDYFLFSHPWPKDDTLKDKSIMTSTSIKPGERVYLSHGSWEVLVNRIGNLPSNAKIKGDIDVGVKPLFGIGYICAGVMGVIPESERGKLSPLINYANKNAPFISPFTWGEQGNFPGVGNKHGNLLTSFLVVASIRR
jgi:hypothetical protein